MRKRTLIIFIVLLVLMAILFINGVKNGGNRVTSPIRVHNSISDMVKSTSFKFNIPKALAEEKDLKYESISNKMIHIWNNNYDFKAAPYIADNLDVGGIYEQFISDTKYITLDKHVENVRIRYNTLDSGIILNWKHGEVAYYILAKNETSIEEVLELIELKLDDIAEIKDTSENNEEQINNTYEIKQLNSTIQIDTDELVVIYDEFNNITNLFLGNTIVISIYPNDIVNNIMDEIKLTDDYKLGILKNIPNSIGELEKDTFEQIKNNIYKTIDSLKIME